MEIILKISKQNEFLTMTSARTGISHNISYPPKGSLLTTALLPRELYDLQKLSRPQTILFLYSSKRSHPQRIIFFQTSAKHANEVYRYCMNNNKLVVLKDKEYIGPAQKQCTVLITLFEVTKLNRIC